MKERLYFWGTVTPLIAMLLYMHSEYLDQEKVMLKMMETQSRQLQLVSAGHKHALDRQEKEFIDVMMLIEKHHRQEVEAVLEHARQINKDGQPKDEE